MQFEARTTVLSESERSLFENMAQGL